MPDQRAWAPIPASALEAATLVSFCAAAAAVSEAAFLVLFHAAAALSVMSLVSGL